MARFVTIWFRQLKTDWFTIRQPALRNSAFVLSANQPWANGDYSSK